ncbi:uncharacterized protein TNCV_1581891 [Trichonephila clavipes]|nr:uncharacterized protein TNCV_1581891 [Trichonephila clavipes]
MLSSCVMHRHTGSAPGIMAWGGIGYHSRAPLVRIAGTLNFQRYISEVFYEIPSNLACAYLKGHLRDKTNDCYEIFGSNLVQETATDFLQLKEALTENFPVVQNRNDLELKFYLVHQKEALVEHVFARLEPQVQDYVEIRIPTTTAKLLQVMSKFEERYSCKEMQGSRINENLGRRDWDVRRMSNDDFRHRNWRDAEVVHSSNDRRNGYRGTYGNDTQRNQRNEGFESRNRFDRDNQRFNNNGKYQSREIGVKDLITNIPHTEILYSLDLRLGYFQLAVNPSDVVKTAFVTKQGTYAFTRMFFGLSGAASNFQKCCRHDLKTGKRAVCERIYGRYHYFVAIVCSPRQAFKRSVMPHLSQEAGLTLNKDKCKFGCDKLKYLGLEISKEGTTMDEAKFKEIVEMRPPKNSPEVSKFFGVTQCCQVIYSQFGLAIHQNDHQARRRFVEWAQNEIAVVPDFHKRILFSDEAHFWLNGYVNKQNCRIWSEANPQVYVEIPLHPEKLTVWCAL